jgi:hypothetical protein
VKCKVLKMDDHAVLDVLEVLQQHVVDVDPMADGCLTAITELIPRLSALPQITIMSMAINKTICTIICTPFSNDKKIE